MEPKKYWPPEDILIEINGEEIIIYALFVPDKEFYIDEWVSFGELEIVNVLRKL